MTIKNLYITLFLSLTNYCVSQTDGCGAGSTLLTPGLAGAACAPVAGSTTAAFTDSNQGCTAGNENDDGFYRFIATATSHTITIDGAANFDAVIGAYTACGGVQPTGGTCVDGTGGDGIETLSLSGLTIGNTYFISVHDFDAPAGGGFGDFTICITTPAAAPVNDLCAGAITTACAGTYTGSTTTATSASDPSTLCGVTPAGNGVWYVFAGDGNVITASLCGSSYDTELNLYSGSCAGLTCIDGNDDFCGSSSQLTFTSTIGINYYLLVNGYGGASGSYTLAITCAAPPIPTAADCGGANTICTNANLVGNSSGGGNIDDFSAGNTDCLDPPENQTTWLYFSSSVNGTVGFTITPGLTTDDYDWAIWGPMSTVTCPPTAAPIRCSAADGNGTPANITGLGNGAGDTSEGPSGDGWVSLLNVLAGDVYVMVIDNWTGTSSPFTLSWQLSGGATLDCTSLPIELLFFDAKYVNNVVQLNWTTATELNNDFFTVEKTTDGTNYSTVAVLQSASGGNGTNALSYSSLDRNPESGLIYYRLKQTDFNGDFKYSNLVKIVIENEEDLFHIKPNPTSQIAELSYRCRTDEKATLTIYDYNGRLIFSEEVYCSKGQNTAAINLNEQPDGIYFITMVAGNRLHKTKLIKKQN